MLRFGPDAGPIAILALPLFEEASRVRALAVALCRSLAERGVASAVPDVPGQGESVVAVQDASLADMRSAFATAVVSAGADRFAYVVAIRSGVLVATTASVRGEWSLAPEDGPALRRQLDRIHRTVARPDETADYVEIAGNRISRTLLAALDEPAGASSATHHRVVRLDGDPGAADRHLAGPPLWRRAEPGNDAALAARLAEDIAGWISACAK